MNTGQAKNILFLIKENKNWKHDIDTLCLKRVQSGQNVLLLSDETPQFRSLMLELNVSKEELQRFVNITPSTLDAVIQILLNLHDWALLPDLVIVNLQHFVHLYVQNKTQVDEKPMVHELTDYSEKCLMHRICFFLAGLFSYMESVDIGRKRKCTTDTSPCCSLVLLPAQNDYLTGDQLELLLNLYYYKNNAFDNFTELKDYLEEVFG